jgi:threonine aldolase
MQQTYKIDFFSDTNTNPSQEMRNFMCQAKVGNEVAGEDPTVNYLIERVCDLLGKESALFLPSGTMCNGISYRVLCKRPGDIIILDKSAHPLHKSSGLIAGLAQAIPYPVEGERGIFTASQIEPILEQNRGYNVSVPRVVSVEQTTNFGGGAIWPLQTLKDVCNLAHQYKSYTHLDGAHLLNAVIETGISAQIYASLFDAVWIDFSKSLGAPMGAVLAGSKDFIEEAWYYKFQQGGGMHQAGILAAGCIYALDHNLQKLKEIHDRARQFGKLLNNFPFFDTNPIDTNIIIIEVNHPVLNAFDFERLLKEKGIRVFSMDKQTIRIMVHLDIRETDIHEVIVAIEAIEKN